MKTISVPDMMCEHCVAVSVSGYFSPITPTGKE